MLFVMYNTNIQNPDAQPIKIHIPLGGGKVCGFFSLKEHQTNEKYKELIDKADYKYFCVIGNAIILYFHHKQLKAAVPYDILSSIELWDNMIQWQQELMGIEDVHPKQMNNHIFAISPEGGYMWASEGRIGFVYTVLGISCANLILWPPEIPGDRHTRSVMYIKVPLTGPAQQSPPTIYSPITRFISSVRTAPEDRTGCTGICG